MNTPDQSLTMLGEWLAEQNWKRQDGTNFDGDGAARAAIVYAICLRQDLEQANQVIATLRNALATGSKT